MRLIRGFGYAGLWRLYTPMRGLYELITVERPQSQTSASRFPVSPCPIVGFASLILIAACPLSTLQLCTSGLVSPSAPLVLRTTCTIVLLQACSFLVSISCRSQPHLVGPFTRLAVSLCLRISRHVQHENRPRATVSIMINHDSQFTITRRRPSLFFILAGMWLVDARVAG